MILVGIFFSLVFVYVAYNIATLYAHRISFPKKMANKISAIMENCNVYEMEKTGELIAKISWDQMIGQHVSTYVLEFDNEWYSISRPSLIDKIRFHLEKMGYRVYSGFVVKTFTNDYYLRRTETVNYSVSFNKSQFIRVYDKYILVQNYEENSNESY